MDHEKLPARVAKRHALMFAAFLAVMSPRAVAAADSGPDPTMGPNAGLEAAYRKTIKDGVSEYDAHHFEEARSLFRRAHEMNPNARTFRGIGMTSFELRDYVLAVHNLSAALHDQRKPLSAEQRKDAQDLLDRSRMFVDVYTLTVSPWDAHVIIDGHAPEFEPDGTMLFSFGEHSLEVSAPGMATRTLSFNVRGGERKELSIGLEPATGITPRPSAPATTRIAASAKPAPGVARSGNGAAVSWLLAGGAAALLAGGTAFYWSSQNSQLSSCRNPSKDWLCTNESTIKRQWDISLGAMAVTGAAALTMALVGVLTWKSGPVPAAKHSALDCAVGPVGITCGSTFQ